MIPLNFHHLYYFYTVAKAGSIARATETLLLAQPTISAQIKEFEKFLKRPLFERRNRRLVLTEDGRLVLDYAESIFELGRELEDAVRDRRPGGAVAVQAGVVTGTPRAFAATLAESLGALSPDSPLALREVSREQATGDLRDQRLDLVLTTERLPGTDPGEFHHRLAGRVPLRFVAAPAVARRIRRWPGDMDRAPLILPGVGPVQRHVLEWLARRSISPRVVAEVDDAEIALRLAAAGRGIAFVNAISWARATPSLPAVGSSAADWFETVYLVVRRRKHPNPVAARLHQEFGLGGFGDPGVNASSATKNPRRTQPPSSTPRFPG